MNSSECLFTFRPHPLFKRFDRTKTMEAAKLDVMVASTNSKINYSFLKLKPLCDSMAVLPSKPVIARIVDVCESLPKTHIQELFCYIHFPFTMHMSATTPSTKDEIKLFFVEGSHKILKCMEELCSLDQFNKLLNAYVQQILGPTQPNEIVSISDRVSEELMLEVMEAMTTLSLNVPDKLKVNIYDRAKCPKIALGIYVSVLVAKHKQYRKLRISAINCALALTSTHNKYLDETGHHKDPMVADAAAEMLVYFLPGMAGGLQDVANGDQKQGYLVTMTAMMAIHRIVCLVMRDDLQPDNIGLDNAQFMNMIATHLKPKEDTQDANSVVTENIGNGLPCKLKYNKKRCPEWYQTASERLKTLTQSLVPLRTHPHFSVRREFAIYCSRIVTECPRNMTPSLGIALDSLIILMQDEAPEVASICHRALEKHAMSTTSLAGYSISDFITENFYTLVSSLLRIFNGIDETEKLSSLKHLQSYLTILADEEQPQSLSRLLSNPLYLEPLVAVLVEGARLDASSLQILSELEPRNSTEIIQGMSHSYRSWCSLRHFRESETEKRFREIICFLGTVESYQQLTDALMDVFLEGGTTAKQAALVLNEMTQSCNCKGAGTEYKSRILQRIISAYTEPDTWYLPLTVHSDEKLSAPPAQTLDASVYDPRGWEKEYTPGLYEGILEVRYTDVSYAQADETWSSEPESKCPTIAQAQNNVLQVCVMTEGIGLIALQMGEDFTPYLIKTLFLILERVGCSNQLVQLAGARALEDVRRACGYASVPHLLQHNGDYFTHHLTRKLRKVSDVSSALHVLVVVMHYSDKTVLPCLYDIVNHVLLQTCDKYQSQNITAYLKVFNCFIMCINKWFSQPENVQNIDIANCSENNHAGLSNDSAFIDLLEHVKHLKDMKDLMESDERETEAEEGKTAEEMFLEDVEKEREKRENVEAESTDMTEEEEKEVPEHVVMTETVLKRCVHFLPSKDPQQKILAITALMDGIRVLQKYDDILLPLVHQIWAPLVLRLKDTSQPVVMKISIRLLEELAKFAKDFIRDRTMKEVWRHLCDFLKKSAKDSYLKDVGSYYRQTQAFKLQKELLLSLGSLATHLKVDERALHELCCSADNYLSKDQPKVLQRKAVELWRTLILYNPYPAWLHLHQLWNNGPIVPGSRPEDVDFHPVHVTVKDPASSDHYAANVSLLIDFFEATYACSQKPAINENVVDAT